MNQKGQELVFAFLCLLLPLHLKLLPLSKPSDLRRSPGPTRPDARHAPRAEVPELHPEGPEPSQTGGSQPDGPTGQAKRFAGRLGWTQADVIVLREFGKGMFVILKLD